VQPADLRLSIDCGASATVAVLAWPDGRWIPLVFEASTVLSSAVHVGRAGEVTAGVTAWQQAMIEPAGLVPEPLRAAPGSVPVGEADLVAQDLVAATLRLVAAEAVRAAGAQVPDVRMVAPAGWGPRRRTWLRSTAYQAGLGQPRLVEAPVAAADRLLTTGVQLPVGAFILVCDAGAGFEATVLRRGSTGFEVLSTLADPAAGGTKIDELLAATVLGAEGPQPAPVPWPAMASLRAAKEALSQQPTVTVLLPAPAGPTVVSSAVLEDVAGPVVKRAGELAAEAVRAAELTPEQLAGVYCIGAGAAAPMLPRALAERLGVAPTVLLEPGFAAVLGAVEAGGQGAPAASVPDPVPPEPPVRRALALAVPGAASLALFAQFLLTASFENGSRQCTRDRTTTWSRTGVNSPPPASSR
jgi:molecular chaperone DnaK (HSP70)